MASMRGTLGEAPIPDVIQVVCQGGRSGYFLFEGEGNRARICIRDGKIVHAVSDKEQGLDAIYDIVTWPDGGYQFEECPLYNIPTTITKSNPIILMELNRRAEEWHVISQVITSSSLHPYSTALPGEAIQDLNPREQKLMSFINGYYTVEELAMATHKSVINVAKELYGLVNNGHVVLKGVRAPKPPRLVQDDVSLSLTGCGQGALYADDIHEDVTGQIDLLVRLRELGLSAMPRGAHGEIVQAYSKAVKGLVSNGADLAVVKQFAVDISQIGVSARCDPRIVKQINQDIRRLFGK